MRPTRDDAGGVYSPFMAESGILAVGATELSVVLILLCVIVVPIATVAFARSGKGYSEIGKGRFAVDFDDSGEADSREEIRQMVEAKAYRQSLRGETPVDVESEVERLLEPGSAATPDETPEPAADPETLQIRAEIREVVVARNESRARQGQPPLDVDAEVERMLAEFG